MFRLWAFWRRVQYGIGFIVLSSVISSGLYFLYIYKAPTCFDTILNGSERGIDCGGVCMRMCVFEITPPLVLWADSFKVVDGQYNVVAYIENRNKDIGSKSIPYIIKLFDGSDLITEIEGETMLPPDGVYPIFEDHVMTGNRIPTRTTFEFVDSDKTIWQKAEEGRKQFSLERRDLIDSDNHPKLTAELRNDSLSEALDVEIVATIFDTSGKPLTASRTTIPVFKERSTESVVFTWPEPIATTLKSCEIPTDVVLGIDLSGSMNNDKDTPPEPITSVLKAARSFVSRINTQDQVGVVTYATNAIVSEQLTSENTRVAESITKLSIDPKEETGSTNTGDALKKMSEELSSERHNQNARKVAILLTDGLATAPDEDPEIYAETQANILKSQGIILYTIGLGTQVNEIELKKLASGSKQYFKAPSINDLHAIYSKITASICEEGVAFIEVIPKAKSSFPTLE